MNGEHQAAEDAAFDRYSDLVKKRQAIAERVGYAIAASIEYGIAGLELPDDIRARVDDIITLDHQVNAAYEAYRSELVEQVTA